MDLPEPTHHAPGSFGKVEELAKRAELELELWHPLDPVDFGPKQIVEWQVPEVTLEQISKFRESGRNRL